MESKRSREEKKVLFLSLKKVLGVRSICVFLFFSLREPTGVLVCVSCGCFCAVTWLLRVELLQNGSRKQQCLGKKRGLAYTAYVVFWSVLHRDWPPNANVWL